MNVCKIVTDMLCFSQIPPPVGEKLADLPEVIDCIPYDWYLRRLKKPLSPPPPIPPKPERLRAPKRKAAGEIAAPAAKRTAITPPTREPETSNFWTFN